MSARTFVTSHMSLSLWFVFVLFSSLFSLCGSDWSAFQFYWSVWAPCFPPLSSPIYYCPSNEVFFISVIVFFSVGKFPFGMIYSLYVFAEIFFIFSFVSSILLCNLHQIIPTSDASQHCHVLIFVSHSSCDYPGSWYDDFFMVSGYLGYYVMRLWSYWLSLLAGRHCLGVVSRPGWGWVFSFQPDTFNTTWANLIHRLTPPGCQRGAWKLFPSRSRRYLPVKSLAQSCPAC